MGMIREIQACATHPFPSSIRNEIELFFGIDTSRLRLGLRPGFEALGLAALAGRSEVYFSESRFDPSSADGRFLLGHEIAHVVQSRSGALPSHSSEDAGFAFSTELEMQADAIGCLFASGREDAGALAERWLAGKGCAGALMARKKHAAALRFAGCYLGGQNRPDRPSGRHGEDVFQANIIVNNAPYPGMGAADMRLNANLLYAHMRDAANRTFYFKDVEALVTFANKRAGLFKSAPHNFTAPDKGVFFEKVADAQVTSFEKRPAVWRAKITVTTDKGNTAVIPVFSSIKRHLILAFMDSQQRPRKAEKTGNSFVKDENLFEQCLRDYAALHAAAIKENLMIFGYEPLAAVHNNPQIAFLNDTTMIPNVGYATEPNGIHSFPDHGTGVRAVTIPQFVAVTKFCLWFFRTEEHLAEGEKFDKITLLSPGEVQAKQKLLEARVAKIESIEKDLAEFKKCYAPPASLAGTNAQAVALAIQAKFDLDKKLPFPQNFLKSISSNIFDSMVDMGVIPAIEEPLRRATNKVSGSPTALKPYNAPGELRFKTHKCEVKVCLPDLPKDLVAWIIDGYVALDADAVIARIENSIVGSKLTVKQQIEKAQSDVAPRTGKSEKSLTNIVEDFYECYEQGVSKNLFVFRL
jgi:hypothetical protein